MGETTLMSPWGKYPVYRDIARFEYGRLLWRNPSVRQQLLAHWNNPEHPYKQRFLSNQALIEEALGSQSSEEELDETFRKRNLSLRVIAREIPPVFGSI